MAALNSDSVSPKNGPILSVKNGIYHLFSSTLSAPVLCGSYPPLATVTAVFTVIGTTVYVDVRPVDISGVDPTMPFVIPAALDTPTIFIPKTRQYIYVPYEHDGSRIGLGIVDPGGYVLVYSDVAGTQGFNFDISEFTVMARYSIA